MIPPETKGAFPFPCGGDDGAVEVSVGTTVFAARGRAGEGWGGLGGEADGGEDGSESQTGDVGDLAKVVDLEWD